MRTTRHAPGPTRASRGAGADIVIDRRDVIVRPAPVAMVWQGVGSAHASIAVPGVALGPGDVLVAVELATVCPADLEAVAGRRRVATPLVLGHEQVGRVVALGVDAETSDGVRLVVGMRVVWSRRIGCGTCAPCLEGSSSRCRSPREYGADRVRRGWELSGAFASHVLVRAGTTVLTVPEIVPAAVIAPVPCATATAAAALEHVLEAVEIDGETVVVVGADLVGLTVAAMLVDEGARVVLVEADRERRERARGFGVSAGVADVAAVDEAVLGERAPVAAVVVCGAAATDDASGAVGSPGAAPVDVAAALGIGPQGIVVDVVPHGPACGAGGAPVPAGGVGSADGDAGLGPTRVVVAHPDPRHLAMAVEFVSSAWFRYPFAEAVSPAVALERLDEVLGAAAAAPFLRVSLDPGRR